jgi:CHAT domain-containing protein
MLLATIARSGDGALAGMSALDQVRLHGGTLAPLPGTRREVLEIDRVIRRGGGETTVLLGEQATVPNLAAAASGRRIVHLATHGLTGSKTRPYDASLAFTQPPEPIPGDIGFLRMEDLIRDWRGRLDAGDLVVLSACESQQGVALGDSAMSLSWGFYFAGAPCVIASLWKVDDAATMLLMSRFYENLVGQFPTPRTAGTRTFQPGESIPAAESLREAKRWLRGLSRVEADARLAADAAGRAGSPIDRGVRRADAPVDAAMAAEQPYADPYYWGAFIIEGAPD